MLDGLVKRAGGSDVGVNIALFPGLGCQLQGLGVLQKQPLGLFVFLVQIIDVLLEPDDLLVGLNQIVLAILQVISYRLADETALLRLLLKSRDFFQ